MLTFPNNSKIQLTKIGLGSDGQIKQKQDSIKFVKACNLVELSDNIDIDTWIYNTIPIEFDYFSTNDDLLEYFGEHSKLLKSNEKYTIYVLDEYDYFGQEINFNEVLQVQPLDVAEDEIPSMEELPSSLQKKEDLTFP